MKLFKNAGCPAAGPVAPVAAGATGSTLPVLPTTPRALKAAASSRSPASLSSRRLSDGLGFQALSNLIERYGCVAGYPNGTYRGNRAMTRFEAAALLNACPTASPK